VGQELTQLMREAKRHCSGGNLDVLTSRLKIASTPLIARINLKYAIPSPWLFR
jgi:hypothetical protein